MASPHTAAIAGFLTVKTEGSCGSRAKGLTVALGLNEGSAAPDTYVYAPTELIDAAATWQDLPIPGGSTLLAVYVRAGNRRDVFSLRLTRAVAGVQTWSTLRGSLLVEADPSDPITAVEVQGELTLEYLGLAAT
mgnify:CR=1 FL=1